MNNTEEILLRRKKFIAVIQQGIMTMVLEFIKDPDNDCFISEDFIINGPVCYRKENETIECYNYTILGFSEEPEE